MKSRLINAAAFVIGVIAVFMLGAANDIAWPIRLALSLLCPGMAAALPLLFLVDAIGLGSLGFSYLLGILINGLIFGLASYLIRKARTGRRLARVALTLGMGAWITWGAVYAIGTWPWPDPPAPVALSSPLSGRWDGVLHGDRGDRSIVLVCHPRADSTLDGYLYVHGWDMGPLENGVYTRDSLHFEILSFNYSARFDHARMAMMITVSGTSNEAELQFVSADTTRPVLQPGTLP